MSIKASFLKAFDVELNHFDLVLVGSVLLGLGEVGVDESQQAVVVAGCYSKVRAFEFNLIKKIFTFRHYFKLKVEI